MGRFGVKFPLLLVVAILGLGISLVKGACEDCVEVKVEDSSLYLARGYRSSLPSVNVTLKHNGQAPPLTEESREEDNVNHTRTIFFKDFDFDLKLPDGNTKKSKPITFDIESSGGGQYASEGFYTTLKFPPCYRKFEIKTAYGSGQIGLGEGAEKSKTFSDPAYPYTNGAFASVSEEEDDEGEKWVYLEVGSYAGEIPCIGPDEVDPPDPYPPAVPFVAKDVTVFVIFEGKPGEPGDGGP